MKVFARIVIVAALAATMVAPVAQARGRNYGPLDPWTGNLFARQAEFRASEYGPLDPWTQNLFARGAQPGLFRTVEVAVTRPVPTRSASGDQFEWTAFGVGAGVMLGVVLLASGAVIGMRRRRMAHA